MRVSPANEEGNVFSLMNITIIGRIVAEHGKEIGRRIINGRFFPRGNCHHLVHIVEEHSVICVLYPPKGIPFVVKNHLVDGWLGKYGMSEESSNILESDDDMVGINFVYCPVTS